MPFYLVTMVHPDGDGWNRHLAAHVRYLQDRVADGTLCASGPLKGTPLRSGFLIFRAKDAAAVKALVDADPFAIEGLIETLTITEWDPLFGTFADEATGDVDALLARATA